LFINIYHLFITVIPFGSHAKSRLGLPEGSYLHIFLRRNQFLSYNQSRFRFTCSIFNQLIRSITVWDSIFRFNFALFPVYFLLISSVCALILYLRDIIRVFRALIRRDCLLIRTIRVLIRLSRPLILVNRVLIRVKRALILVKRALIRRSCPLIRSFWL